MNKYEFKEAFMDLSKDQVKERFDACKLCPSRILAYFKLYDIKDIDYLNDYEFKESKERILDDLDYNLKEDISNLLLEI